jgi:hypothetical protein
MKPRALSTALALAVALGVAPSFGCDELGNPAPGSVVKEGGVRLRSRLRLAPASELEELLTGFGPGALEFSERVPINGYAALVEVEITGVPPRPGARIVLETLFAFEDGRRIARRWSVDGGRSTHVALFAVSGRPIEMITHLPKRPRSRR